MTLPRPSIRWKLTLWYGAVLASGLAVFGAGVYAIMRRELEGQLSRGLLMEMGEVGDEVARARDLPSLRAGLNRRFTRHPGYDIQATAASGEVLLRSERIRERGLPAPESPTAGDRAAFVQFRAGDDDSPYYQAVRAVPGPDGPVRLQVATPLVGTERELAKLLATLVLAGPLALVVALGGGYVLARAALAPVERMASTADQITAERLACRLEVSNPDDELGRLARTLNGMIGRLERSFEEVRRFTADAAHELRTPLAVMRNAAEVILRAPREPAEYRRVLEDQLEEIDRLTRLAEQLLFLCREDARLAALATGSVRLDDLTREVVGHVEVVAAEKGVGLECDRLEPCSVRGDAHHLRRLLFNLLDNAIKFTPTGGNIRVALEHAGGRVLLSIADTGIGIPAEHLPHVFDRFYRADPARGQEASGAGLGLAICHSIAEAHGGSIRLESTPGRGTLAVFKMPASGTDGRSPAGLDGRGQPDALGAGPPCKGETP